MEMNSSPLYRVVVFGATGCLGQEMARALSAKYGFCHTPTHAEVDIADGNEPYLFLGDVRPDVVINCAAMTDVDACESDVVNAGILNHHGPAILAGACASVGARLIHISTDMVFGRDCSDGWDFPGTGWSEDSGTAPVNEYGLSKFNGEQAVRKALDNHVIIRTSWLLGKRGWLPWAVASARMQGSVNLSQRLCRPTLAVDLADEILQKVIPRDALRGTWHFNNVGVVMRTDLYRTVAHLAGYTADVVECDENPTRAPRCRVSILNTLKWEIGFGRPMHWAARLPQVVSEIVNQQPTGGATSQK